MAEFYRHTMPSAGVSLERNTDAVPHDDRFYLLHDGAVVGIFNTRKRGELKFRELLNKIGYVPKPVKTDTTVDPSSWDIERYLDAKEEYWGSSYLYRSRGGKLANR